MKSLKKIGIILTIVSISIQLNAQIEVKDLTTLKTELDTISLQDMPINNVTLSPAGDWIIFYGDIGYTFINAPEKVSQKLAELNKSEKMLKDLDFKENSWLLLSEKNAYYGDSVKLEINAALKTLNTDGNEINCISYSPSGWVLLYDNNSFLERNIPSSAVQKLKNLQYRNQTIKTIVFSENGWIILYAKNGISYSDIPKDLSDKLVELSTSGKEINNVFLLGKHWIIVHEFSKYTSNF